MWTETSIQRHASDSDGSYLQDRYIDLLYRLMLPDRELHISKSALIAHHMVNQATSRQFQNPTFNLSVYNMLVRDVIALAYVIYSY